MRRVGIICAVVLSVAAGVGFFSAGAAAVRQRRPRVPRPAAICPDPSVKCRTSVTFEPHQMPFEVRPDGVIVETEWFYAVILKSMRDTAQDCTVFVPEPERIEAQALFPRHKVFASRCYDPGELFYEKTAEGHQFMAVYAGRTRAEAARMLAKVKATGKFPGANLRRTRTGFNGT